MLRLEIKHLRLVDTIAEVGNLTRAAHVLCLSQPALSKQLAELEERLGFALFHRSKAAMSLTEPGIIFRRNAINILSDMDGLEAELTRYGKGDTGKIRVSIDRVHRADWLPTVMTQFRARHPRIELEVRQVPDLLHSLRQREVDIVVVGEAIKTTGIDYIALHEDEMVAVLPASHPLSKKDYITIHDLEGMDMIYYFDLKKSYLYRRYLHPNRISLGAFHYIQDIDVIITLVKSEEGMTLLPKRLLKDAIEGSTVDVRRIGQEGFKFTWYAAFSLESDKPYMNDFVRLIQTEMT